MGFEELLLHWICFACRFATIGVVYAGIEGAMVGVLTQRVISSLLCVIILGHVLKSKVYNLLIFVFKMLVPFILCSGLLFLLSPERHINSKPASFLLSNN